MAWYDDSTITVTGGSPMVTGAGTAFVDNVKAGDALRGPDERLYQIASVNSATSLTLTRNYAGASAAGQTYEILPTQDALAVLARNVASLIEDFQDIADNAGQGMFGDGSVGTPGLRFVNDLDTGMWRAAPNVIAWATGGVERFRVDASGNFYIGATAFAGGVPKFGVKTSAADWAAEIDGNSVAGQSYGLRIKAGTNGGDYAAFVSSADGTQNYFAIRGNGNVGVGTSGPADRLDVYGTVRLTRASASTVFGQIWSEADTLFVKSVYPGGGSARIEFQVSNGSTTQSVGAFDGVGNLLVNTASPFYSGHVINKSTAAGNAILTMASATTGMKSAVFLAVSAEGWNGADAALWLGKQANGRSLNAPGTVNASGADYAEYMTKAAGCGTIAKGDACGVDADGKLTQSWAAAHSFVVKSTDPSLVGGDIWANDLDPRPAPPTEPGAAPVAPTAPEPFTDPEPTPEADESEGAFAVRHYIWGQAAAAAAAAQTSYAAAVEGFSALLAAWEDVSATYAADLVAYEAALAGWQAELEAARVKVDRIAFSGQVPANLTGAFSVGDYVVAAEGADDTITAIAVPRATFFASPDHQANRIGKVWAIREGRAWIDVQHG